MNLQEKMTECKNGKWLPGAPISASLRRSRGKILAQHIFAWLAPYRRQRFLVRPATASMTSKVTRVNKMR